LSGRKKISRRQRVGGAPTNYRRRQCAELKKIRRRGQNSGGGGVARPAQSNRSLHHSLRPN